MATDEISYAIHGDSLQYVEIELDEDESVVAEAGALLFMEEGIDFSAQMGDGSSRGLMGSLMGAARRMVTSESLFMTRFTNDDKAARKVAFAAPYPGHIVPIALNELGDDLICQKDAFLCAARGTRITVAFTKRLGIGFFGGEGFILQKLKGDGIAFLHAGGTVIERTLDDEELRVDTGCVVAFEESIDYDIRRVGGLKSMLFGGEGLFLATLSGKGKVWLQTMPFSRLADLVIQHAPSMSGSSDKGES